MVEKQENFKHIVRIANVDIPGEKQLRVALTKIKGIGTNIAQVACVLAKLDPAKKTGNLEDSEISTLNDVINNPGKAGMPEWMFNRRKDMESGVTKHLLTGSLNFVQDNDLKRLKKIKTLRGMRHQKKLPVRGQRTKSNFRKGKSLGVKRKKK